VHHKQEYLNESAIDVFFAYSFIKKLATEYIKTDAFKTGVIDKDGKILIPSNKRNKEQKAAFTVFDRLVWNIRTMIQKYVPFGGTRLARYSTALFLLKEHKLSSIDNFKIVENVFLDYLKEVNGEYFVLNEETKQLTETQMIPQHNTAYKLNEDLITSGETIPKGDTVIFLDEEPYDEIMGTQIWRARHVKSGDIIHLTVFDTIN
jgi:hypothetical protein